MNQAAFMIARRKKKRRHPTPFPKIPIEKRSAYRDIYRDITINKDDYTTNYFFAPKCLRKCARK